MTSGFEIIRYDATMKAEWDYFVDNSKNGTFLFKRDYMDYHSDRFEDNSLIIVHKDKIYSLLPACKMGNIISSHAGLTYGGLIIDEKATTAGILNLFTELASDFKKEGIKEWIYKPVPHIYHKIPSEEDLYALFRLNAHLIARNISTTIDLTNGFTFRKLRNRGIKKAFKEGIIIGRDSDFYNFWKVLEKNLEAKYFAKPVHSLDEIEKLAEKFPLNINLFTAKKNNETLAGVVCYDCGDTVHCQYISASPYGKESGALDFLFNFLIKDYFKKRLYFDFGTSNEENGHYLNESLIFYKEGFGGRGICYDTYKIIL